MSEPFLGQITVFPYNFAPYGWMDCVGQILPISQYSALFSLLGTAYGGNGTSNFGLPNLQAVVPVGQGQAAGGSNYVMGETGGTSAVTITSSTLPAHSHTMSAVAARGTTSTPSGMLFAEPTAGSPPHVSSVQIYNTTAPATPLSPASIAPAGGSQPHNNLQPFLGLRYCIAIQGQFPVRS